jgi:hypothetical protein
MPPAMAVEREELSALINAAIHWIDASEPASDNKNFLERLKGFIAGVLPKGESAHV